MALMSVSFTSESSDHYLVQANGVLSDLKREIEKLPEPIDNLYINCVVCDCEVLTVGDIKEFINGGM